MVLLMLYVGICYVDTLRCMVAIFPCYNITCWGKDHVNTLWGSFRSHLIWFAVWNANRMFTVVVVYLGTIYS